MKKWSCLFLLCALCLPVLQLGAQEKPKAEERAKVPTPVKSLRTGIRVPIELESKDQKTTYLDIGTNIDCGIRTEDDGRFHVYLIFDRSALHPNKSSEGERLVASPGGQPVIRQFRTSENLMLKDGQSSENLLSTDPLTGHTLRVTVTINVQK